MTNVPRGTGPAWMLAALLASSGLTGSARAAAIVECVDAGGVAVLSSATTGPACLSAKASRVAKSDRSTVRLPSPAAFPTIDGATQRGRDTDRVRILRDELASEEGRLAALESTPRAPAERASAAPLGAATAAVADQLARTRENIRALQRELSGAH